MTYIDDSAAQLIFFEGLIPWMYLDTDGNVTAGCGFLLSNAADACKLPFQIAGVSATTNQIVDDFSRVRAMKRGLPAAAYYASTSPTLRRVFVQQHLAEIVTTFDTVLNRLFTAYPSFAENPRLGLLDMVYNLGEQRLVREFIRFCAAVNKPDWREAAEQSHRMGISDARNSWTKSMFMSACVSA